MFTSKMLTDRQTDGQTDRQTDGHTNLIVGLVTRNPPKYITFSAVKLFSVSQLCSDKTKYAFNHVNGQMMQALYLRWTLICRIMTNYDDIM